MTGRGRSDPARAAQLGRLQALAQMKAEVELARLAATGQSRARLQAALDALGSAETPLASTQDAAGAPIVPAAAGPAPMRPAPADPVPMDPAPIDPALVRARLAHAGWVAAQRRELNARLAMVMADWHRLQPAAARAEGRARVLERLTEQALASRRARERP